MNLIDRFLYKIFILAFILCGVVGLDRLGVLSLKNLQTYMSTSINTVKVISTLSGKNDVFNLGDDEMAVMNHITKTENIANGKKIILDDFNGVENRYLGSVVKITKNNNLYDVYIQAGDGKTYCYSSLLSIDVNMYEIVKAGSIIGQANYQNDYYYNYYIYNGNKLIQQ